MYIRQGRKHVIPWQVWVNSQNVKTFQSSSLESNLSIIFTVKLQDIKFVTRVQVELWVM